MKYTKEYFIEKFEAIPDEQWSPDQMSTPTGAHCALGHCGVSNFQWKHTKESKALTKLFDKNNEEGRSVALSNPVIKINDTGDSREPKDVKKRVLEALKEL